MKKARIVVINGAARSGKDTFIDFMEKSYSPMFRHSTVLTVKDAAFNFGYSGDKTEKERKFLSDLKNLWTQFNDGPFWEIVNRFEFLKEHSNNFLFAVCVREPEEIQKIKEKYPDAVTVLIRRPGLKIPDNMADQNVEHFNYDVVIENDSGLNDLKQKASNFLEDLPSARNQTTSESSEPTTQERLFSRSKGR